MPAPDDYNFIARTDANAIVHLLGQLALHTGSLPDKRRSLLNNFLPLIDADAWWWLHCKVQDGRPHLLSFLDAGWQNDLQRHLATTAHYTPHVEIINPHFRQRVAAGQHVTLARRQMIPDALWFDSPFFKDYFHPAHIADFLGSCFPLADHKISSIGFHRFDGKPPFSPREASLTHLLTSQIPWLHSEDADLPSAAVPPALSDRQRQILILLLQGQSTKQISAKLNLSIHTINDHLKTLHKHYRVSSRQELLSLFIAGNPPPATHP